MPETTRHEAQDHTFEEVETGGSPDTAQHLELDDLRGVVLNVAATLGKCFLRVREVLELKVGTVVPLDKMAGEMSDISINGLPLAKGEVVVIGDVLHVRIAEVTGDFDVGFRDDIEA